MKSTLFYPIACIAWATTNLLAVAQESPRRGVNNTQEPWVFRVVLDSRPRVLVAALDDSLWAAWDTQRCRLFQTWKPGELGVKLQGAVFNGAHGPQPVSDGTRLHQEPAESAWYALEKQEPIAAAVRYRGHRTGAPGELSLSYQLTMPDGNAVIAIEETPTFRASSGPSLSRKFSVQGLPQGQQIALQLSGDAAIWRTEGANGEFRELGQHRYLVIRQNGEITLVGSWKNL